MNQKPLGQWKDHARTSNDNIPRFNNKLLTPPMFDPFSTQFTSIYTKNQNALCQKLENI